MTVVVDASVGIKWVLDEDGSLAARQLFSDEILIAPDFLLIECANILWAAARRGRIVPDAARAGLAAIGAAPVAFYPAGTYLSSAQTLAFELGQTVYDSLYLAVAIAEHAALVTADQAFLAGVMRHGFYSYAVRPLA